MSTYNNDSNVAVAPRPGSAISANLKFPTWPHYSEDEVEAAAEVLRSGKVNYWTGDDVGKFEQELKGMCGLDYTIALSNGTIALDFALHALGVGHNDEVICTSRSFVASASCAMRVGATPVFADVDINSQNVTAATIEACITAKTKAVVVVHLAGWPCDMKSIMELCDAKGIHVIEDCAQAHGATYEGKPVGSFGIISTWSFCQDKILSTGGEGGCVATNDKALYEALWILKEHGKSYRKVHDRSYLSQSSGYKWLHDSAGGNARMTGFQAAIGKIQLGKLNSWVAKRNANANYLWSACSGISGLRVPELPGNIRHSCYLGYVYIDAEKLGAGWSRDKVMGEIISRDVPVSVGSCPELYREGVFHSVHDQSKRLPVARQLGRTSMAFPVHPALGSKHMERMCSVIGDVMASAAK